MRKINGYAFDVVDVKICQTMMSVRGVKRDDIPSFIEQVQLGPAEIDRLEAEGGVCIVYTHLAYGFANDGIMDSTFVARVSDLAARDAWIAPASEILDFMKEHGQGGQTLSFAQRTWLELKWLWEKLILGQT